LFRQRLRVWFRVAGDKRYLSHHDMMRLWERAIRRAGLPLRMSQGFNPRPKLSLAEPRSVGIASEAELLEFELADWVNPDAVLGALRREVPPEIEVSGLDVVRPTDKARPEAVVYVVRLSTPCPDLRERIGRLLAQSEARVVRHRPTGDKLLDARPFIDAIESDDREVRMVLRTGPGGTVRPDEVLRLLGLEAEAVARADKRRTEIRLG
jgi:radical SAM-linked protein